MRKLTIMAAAAFGMSAMMVFADHGLPGKTGTGGNIVPALDDGMSAVHTFLESGTFVAPDYAVKVEFVVIGGGGGGGACGGVYGAGGGGAGGMLTGAVHVAANAECAIVVGAGGAGGSGGNVSGKSGGNSSFTVGATTFTALGGGYGPGYRISPGGSGGNGGGGACDGTKAGSGTQKDVDGVTVIGFNGGNGSTSRGGGAGGGAGQAGGGGSGQNGGKGGDGKISRITGEAVYYAGGGAGGAGSADEATTCYGGKGGGGNAGHYLKTIVNGADGLDGYGGGGGAGSGYDGCRNGGKGGNGVVILRYTIIPNELTVRAQLDSFSASSVRMAGNVICAGNQNETAEVWFGVREASDATPVARQKMLTGLVSGEDFTVTKAGLTPGTLYRYELSVSNLVQATGQDFFGTFSTESITAAGGNRAFALANGDFVHVFDRAGTYVFKTFDGISARILLVGGGGGGGAGNGENYGGGGGGAGGVLTNQTSAPIAIPANSVCSITVGAGGAGGTSAGTWGTNGGNTTLTIGGTTYTALGGGGGASGCAVGKDGGNGGGSAAHCGQSAGQQMDITGTILVGQKGGGNDYRGGAGGGGAGEPGQTFNSYGPTGGGNGIVSDITGEEVWYAGGGGGGGGMGNDGGAGGKGGGANGNCVYVQALHDYEQLAPGVDGLGGGGGGGRNSSPYIASSAGGCGTVIIRYQATAATPTGIEAELKSLTLGDDGFPVADNVVYWPGTGAETVSVTMQWGTSSDALDNSVVLSSADIGSRQYSLRSLPLGAHLYVKLVYANSTGTQESEVKEITTPPLSVFVPPEPVVDKENKTVRFTGTVAGVGCGTTTLTLEYGPTVDLGTTFDCGSADYGSSFSPFDTGIIDCRAPVRMSYVYYRYVLVQQSGDTVLQRIETPIRQVNAIRQGLMVIFR